MTAAFLACERKGLANGPPHFSPQPSALSPQPSALIPILDLALFLSLGCAPAPIHAESEALSSPASAFEAEDAILVRPNPISLGSLQQGQRGEATAAFRNQAQHPVTLSSFESTCPCVRITPLPITLGPGESTVRAVSYDPTENPDFHGQLQVDLIGRQDDNATLCHASVILSVASGRTGASD